MNPRPISTQPGYQTKTLSKSFPLILYSLNLAPNQYSNRVWLDLVKPTCENVFSHLQTHGSIINFKEMVVWCGVRAAVNQNERWGFTFEARVLLIKVEAIMGSILVIVVMVEVRRWSSSRGRLGFCWWWCWRIRERWKWLCLCLCLCMCLCGAWGDKTHKPKPALKAQKK